MTTAYSDADTDDSEGHGAPCAGCDPGLLDDLKCQAKGIKAQATYNEAHETRLTTARTDYDGARSAYGAAWSDARPEVVDLGKQLLQITDQLKCLVDDSVKIRLLDRAFWRVERRLRDCFPNTGCTFDDDCDFDDKVSECEADDIAAVIADIERRIGVAETAFAELITEPTTLAKRVADLKTEVAAIVTKMSSDPRTVNFKDLYAAALVAQDHLDTVWNGFSDVNEYMDCLCRALTCQIKGYSAVSRLKRKEAEHQCHDDQKKTACEHLRDHTADEVIAEYLRLKARAGREREHSGRGDDAEYGDQRSDRGGGRESDGGRESEKGHDRDSDRYGAEERGRS